MPHYQPHYQQHAHQRPTPSAHPHLNLHHHHAPPRSPAITTAATATATTRTCVRAIAPDPSPCARTRVTCHSGSWLRDTASFSSVRQITNTCFLSFYVFFSASSSTGWRIASSWLDADALRVVVTVTHAIAEARDFSPDIRPRTACVSTRICHHRSFTD